MQKPVPILSPPLLLHGFSVSPRVLLERKGNFELAAIGFQPRGKEDNRLELICAPKNLQMQKSKA